MTVDKIFALLKNRLMDCDDQIAQATSGRWCTPDQHLINRGKFQAATDEREFLSGLIARIAQGETV